MRLVPVAIIPQPISTPTAAGTIAPCVAMTEPTVAPIPTCASGMSATCEWTNGNLAVSRAWSRVFSSIPSAPQTRSLSSTLVRLIVHL